MLSDSSGGYIIEDSEKIKSQEWLYLELFLTLFFIKGILGADWRFIITLKNVIFLHKL